MGVDVGEAGQDDAATQVDARRPRRVGRAGRRPSHAGDEAVLDLDVDVHQGIHVPRGGDQALQARAAGWRTRRSVGAGHGGGQAALGDKGVVQQVVGAGGHEPGGALGRHCGGFGGGAGGRHGRTPGLASPTPLRACGAVCGAGPRVRVRQRAPHHPKGRRPPSGPAAAAMAPPRPRTVRAVRASALGALLLLASTASTAPAPHPHPPLSPHGAALADLARAAAHAAVDALSRDGAAYDLEAVHTGTLEAGGRGLGWL